MAGRGCFANDRISFSIQSIHSWGNDVSDIQIAKQQYADREVRWMEELIAHDLRIATLPSETKPVVCSAVTRSAEVLSSTGRLFSCTEYPLVDAVETDGRALARVDDPELGAVRPLGPFDDWYDGIEGGETSCNRCTFLPVCGGACPKLWRQGHWPCPSYKFNIQHRMDMTAHLNGLRRIDPDEERP